MGGVGRDMADTYSINRKALLSSPSYRRMKGRNGGRITAIRSLIVKHRDPSSSRPCSSLYELYRQGDLLLVNTLHQIRM